MSRDQKKAAKLAIRAVSNVSFNTESLENRKKVSKQKMAQIRAASSRALAAAAS